MLGAAAAWDCGLGALRRARQNGDGRGAEGGRAAAGEGRAVAGDDAGVAFGEKSLSRGMDETLLQRTGLGLGEEMPAGEVSEAGPPARCRGEQEPNS